MEAARFELPSEAAPTGSTNRSTNRNDMTEVDQTAR
jgi:hypothetical protein